MQEEQNTGIDRRTTLGALAKAGSAAFFIPAWNRTIEAQGTTVTEGPYSFDPYD
jgi:hypothetical protein